MIKISVKILFDKFQQDFQDIDFPSGINVIYGESGVGKSQFLNSLNGKPNSYSSNFTVHCELSSLKIYRLFQNPDHQILGRSVKGDLAFNGECVGRSHSELKSIVERGLDILPDTIDPDANPGLLSGGEKELLNLVTAIQSDADALFIDDSLSFLSNKNKQFVVSWLKNWITEKNGIVVWMTSEKDDYRFGDLNWELELHQFQSIESSLNDRYIPIQIPKGNLSLDFSKVSFRYDNSRLIYSDFSLSIRNGRSIGILGENGSGKTTFAGLCFGYLEPTNGYIKLSIDGKTDLKVGYADQFPEHLFQLKTPEEFIKNLIENDIFDVRFEQTFKNRLSRFGIQWDKIFMKRGVNLPWAVLRSISVVLLAHCNFDILILDEPTFGLGWKQRVILRSFLRECMTKMHLVLVSHDRLLIQSMCDKIIDLDSKYLLETEFEYSEKTKA